MTSRLVVDPVLSVVNLLSQWTWHQVVGLLGITMAKVVFRPLGWPASVLELYGMSRDLAWSLAAVLVIVAVLRSMWPSISLPWVSSPVPALLERLAAAGLISLAGTWVVGMILDVNNKLVGVLFRAAVLFNPAAAPTGILSPLIVLTIGLAMMGLMLYLAVFYAIRAIELYVLTAAIPWFALWWATRHDDAALSNLFKELIVVIFIQTFHAAAFWLATRLMASPGLGLMGFFMELALLWYMTKLPGQFRRLVGAGAGVSRLWR